MSHDKPPVTLDELEAGLALTAKFLEFARSSTSDPSIASTSMLMAVVTITEEHYPCSRTEAYDHIIGALRTMRDSMRQLRSTPSGMPS